MKHTILENRYQEQIATVESKTRSWLEEEKSTLETKFENEVKKVEELDLEEDAPIAGTSRRA